MGMSRSGELGRVKVSVLATRTRDTGTKERAMVRSMGVVPLKVCEGVGARVL